MPPLAIGLLVAAGAAAAYGIYKAATVAAQQTCSSKPAGASTQGCPLACQPSATQVQAAKDVFPGHQSYENCGLQSARQIVEQSKGVCLSKTELEFLNDAIAGGYASKGTPHPDQSGGTGATGRQDLLASYGVPSSVTPTTEASLKQALLDKKGIIANVDAGTLWNDPQYVGGGHAIVLDYGKFDKDCNLEGVYINDTGAGQQGRYLPIKDFMNAANAKTNGSSLNITDKPIWP